MSEMSGRGGDPINGDASIRGPRLRDGGIRDRLARRPGDQPPGASTGTEPSADRRSAGPPPASGETQLAAAAPLATASSPAVVYLEPDDEITSAAARLRRASGARVAVVLPYGSFVATSRINFKLLAREASAHGKRLEIVAADPSARALAASAGLAVHPSVAAFEGREEVESAASGGLDRLTAQTAGAGAAYGDLTLPWAASGPPAVPTALGHAGQDSTATRRLPLAPHDAPRIPLVGRPRPVISARAAVLGLSLLALVLLGGGAVAYSSLPSATITLTPRTEPVAPLQLVVAALPDVTAPDLERLVIPAQRFTFDLAVEQSFPATGVRVTEAKATGAVRFSSFNTSSSNTIEAGSVVRTESDVAFTTLADVTLPPASIDFSDPLHPAVVPSTASVAIEAVAAGPGGNVDNNTITVLPKGQNRNLTRVTNPEATTGGLREEGREISQADVDAALAALEAALRAQFEAKLDERAGIPVDTSLFRETKTLGPATPSVDPAGAVGQDVEEFTLGMSAQGTVIGVDPGPARELAERRLVARVPDGWRLVDASVDVTVGDPIVAGETISYPLRATATRVRDVDRAALLAEVRGLGAPEARSRLEEYGETTIVLWPDWVTTIPTSDARITFTIDDALAGASPRPSGGASTTLDSAPPAAPGASTTP